MYQSDYILRMIEQLGVMVRRLLAALREARPDEALKISDEALEVALDLDRDVVATLTGEGLVTYLGAGGEPDSRQALLVGQVLAGRAEACARLGDESASAAETARARVVLEIVAVGDDEEAAATAAEALRSLDTGR